MKKTLFFAIAALAVFASCNKEVNPIKQVKPIVFAAGIDVPADLDNKVSLNATTGKVNWVAGDEVTISNGTNSGVYKADSTGRVTTFTYKSGTQFTEAGTYTATYGTAPVPGVDQINEDAFTAPAGENVFGTNGKLNPNAILTPRVYMEAPEVTTTSASESPYFIFEVKCGILQLSLQSNETGKSVRRICVSDGTNYYRLICKSHIYGPREFLPIIGDKANDSFYFVLPAGSYTKYIIRDSLGKEVVKTAKAGKEGTVIVNNQINKVVFDNLEFSEPLYAIDSENNVTSKRVADRFWSTVNCGSKVTSNKGLLYQWGRKYGQACSGSVTTKTITSLITLTDGNADSLKSKFFNVTSGDTWCIGAGVGEDKGWPTEYDPCPFGWKIPTEDDLTALMNVGSQWTSIESQNGRRFPATGEEYIFIPAVGYRDRTSGSIGSAGSYGYLWCSSPNSNTSKALTLKTMDTEVDFATVSRANGFSIRCVQD